MIYQYSSNYSYNQSSISSYAPETIGVYYCGAIINGRFYAFYVGRAVGDGVSIRSRLLDHLRGNSWMDVKCFGYRTCTTVAEAVELERQEIDRLKPKYNQIGKI